jgi:hypothetical protein
MSYSRAVAYIRPPVSEPHRLTSSGERFRILVQTDAEVVDKLPLRVALEESAPDVQYCETKLERRVRDGEFALLVKVDNSVGLLHDAFDPVDDAVFGA